MPARRKQSAVVGSDGLRAREAGPWARDKLEFLDHFCPAAIQATARKHHRFYVDLFAGPGMNVSRQRGQQFEGSPLRVLRYTALARKELSFTDAVFVNADPQDHEALVTRVESTLAQGESRIPRERIQLIRGDANALVGQLLEQIPKHAYVFVFVDIENPTQWPWTSMQRLRSLGHKSLDTYMLFPLDMAIIRLLAYAQGQREKNAAALSRFLGTDQWRQLANRRLTQAQSRQLRQGMVALYLGQLGTLWQNAGEIMDVKRRGKQGLYKMVFASDHPVGTRIADWIRDHQATGGQTNLFT